MLSLIWEKKSVFLSFLLPYILFDEKKKKKKICFSYFKLVFNDRKPYEALMLRVGTIFMCVFKLRQVAQIFQKKKKLLINLALWILVWGNG